MASPLDDVYPAWLPQRFKDYLIVNPATGCWLWTGRVSSAGYAQVSFENAPGTLHRIIWIKEHGGVIPDDVLDHLCHTNDPGCPGGVTCVHRRCCNPSHLEDVTRGENNRRGRGTVAANLAKTACMCGRPYDRVDPRGWRHCTHCERERERAKRRAAGVGPAPAARTHCPQGHAYDEKNTRIARNGQRVCRACERTRRVPTPRTLVMPPERKLAMRAEYAAGTMSVRQLAADWGITYGYASNILVGARTGGRRAS